MWLCNEVMEVIAVEREIYIYRVMCSSTEENMKPGIEAQRKNVESSFKINE